MFQETDDMLLSAHRRFRGQTLQNLRPTKFEAVLEVLAVVAPIICLVDCVVIPVVLTVLPLVGIHQIFHGVGDQLLLLLVLAICTPTITLGFLKHKRWSVIVLMTSGFGLMFCANFAGHLIDETVHFILTTMGSVLLVKANFDNRQFRKTPCCAHSHVHASATIAKSIDESH
jgi:hypothetical protein